MKALELRKECKCYELPKEMITHRKHLSISKVQTASLEETR